MLCCNGDTRVGALLATPFSHAHHFQLPSALYPFFPAFPAASPHPQSNSVGYAMDGQMVGVGAGQQSRVDCVKLAGRKVATWYLRQHPKVQALRFKPGSKRQDRVNARVRYIEGAYDVVGWGYVGRGRGSAVR